MENLNITNHAKERYAERIMGRETKTDVVMFISDHEDKIQKDIEKMVEYGDCIYTGYLPSNKDKNIVSVILKDLWVVILDKEKKTVITLYQVDLGVDDELNDIFVKKVVDKINANKEKLEKVKNENAAKIEEYRAIVEENDNLIYNRKKEIKSLEEQNEIYKNLIISLNTQINIAENNVSEVVAKLTGKKPV